MSLQPVNAESFSFTPTTLLSLYTLDSRFISCNGSVVNFHPGVNGLYKPVVFDGVSYTPFPIELVEASINGQGSLSRPKLRCSNIKGFVSAFLLTTGDLVGARLTVKRVYARYIDGVNFANGVNPFGTPDPTAAYEDQIWFINRKISENPDYVEMECSTPWEIDGVKLPFRQLNATVCGFRYRDGETCGYTGVPVSDRFGKLFAAAEVDGGYGYTLNPKGEWIEGETYLQGDWVSVVSQNDFSFGETLVYVCRVTGTTGSINNPQFNSTNWIADMCPHNLLGCDAHFDSPLPFGAAPGISRASYVND
jgi:lambda family phage minor tail protein L